MCPVHFWQPCDCRYARAPRLALALLALGCMPAAAPDVDPCAARIIELEGQRVLEISVACQGYSFDECRPLIDDIDKKYEPKILEQIRCGNDR